jgi:DMSO/TMAO reductase YedYZ molybdopterin-dependent catalytic subunit
LTSVFGSVLLATLPIVIITGLLSYIAYGPQFGQAIPGNVGWLTLPTFDWPTDPSWLYRLNQGLHVGLGLILIPIVLAKLWSVIPRLFARPPSRSIAQVLERISLLMLVGGILFEIITGVLNIQYDYIFGFSFYTAHYYGAWVSSPVSDPHRDQDPTDVDGPAVQVDAGRVAHQSNRHHPRAVRARRISRREPRPPDNEQARCACAC